MADEAINPGERGSESGSSKTLPTQRHQYAFWKLPLEFWSYTLMMGLMTFGCAALGAPSPRLLEMAVCRQYFEVHDPSAIPPSGDIPEIHCKIQEIQRAFTFLLTVLSTCTQLIAMSMQFPMGFLADKRSRRLAFALNITSTILYWDWIMFVGYFHRIFPTWCLYLAPVFILVGGGPWATGALIFAAINDEVTPQQRTMAFSIMEAISGVAELLGSAIGVWTMTHQLWIPFLLATISFAVIFVPTVMVAENRGRAPLESPESRPEASTSENEPLLFQVESGSSDTVQGSTSSEETNPIDSNIPIVAICFGSLFLFYTSRDSLAFIVPWVSFHFNQSMARAGLLLSLKAIVSIILFFAILPTINILLSRKLGLTASAKDLLLSKCSVFLVSLGSFGIAFAPSLELLIVGFTITILGSGVSISLRSFLASMVDSSFTGRLYAAISTVGTLGGLVGMPIMGITYSWGLRHRKGHIAPPFLLAGGLNVFVLLILTSL